MIRSMTAFSRTELESDWGTLIWEIRSVNHRYLEPTFKLPEGIRHLEIVLRERMKRYLCRGKVDCSLKLQQSSVATTTLAIDDNALRALLSACERITQLPGTWRSPSPLEILAWPGLLQDNETFSEPLIEKILQVFDRAVNDLSTSRRGEGAALHSVLWERLDAIDRQLLAIRSLLPDILATHRENLQRRLEEVSARADQERLEQELVYAAQKVDIEEEMDRLVAHVKEVRRVLNEAGPCGRRLDFLMQELNREANTLASKSIRAETSQAAVEMKVLIEQMREQVQNIE